MLERISDFFEWFGISNERKRSAMQLCDAALENTRGMMHRNDLLALAAIAIHHQPKRIFEIGTFRGVTSNFLLDLLPQSELVSIAYVKRFFDRSTYNNSGLGKQDVGAFVTEQNRPRFHQLYGDSHKLVPGELISKFGRFDFVFIDGDHTLDGVIQDTKLAEQIVSPDGVIGWHDANPRPEYQDVEDFLADSPRPALATTATYVGGVACWTPAIAQRLQSRRAG